MSASHALPLNSTWHELQVDDACTEAFAANYDSFALLHSQLKGMCQNVDELLQRRSISNSNASHFKTNCQDEFQLRKHAVFRSPDKKGVESEIDRSDCLLERLLQGLENREMTVSSTLEILERELSALKSGVGGVGEALDEQFTPPSPANECQNANTLQEFGWVVSCKSCAILGQQVKALSQSLAGLGACIFNWSADLNVEHRYSLAELILKYAQPCAHLNSQVENLCSELTCIELNESSDSWHSDFRCEREHFNCANEVSSNHRNTSGSGLFEFTADVPGSWAAALSDQASCDPFGKSAFVEPVLAQQMGENTSQETVLSESYKKFSQDEQRSGVFREEMLPSCVRMTQGKFRFKDPALDYVPSMTSTERIKRNADKGEAVF